MFKAKNWIFLFASLFISYPAYAITVLHVTLNTDDNSGGIGEEDPAHTGDSGDLRWVINKMNHDLNTLPPNDYAIVFDYPMTIEPKGILPVINNSPSSVSITIGNSDPTDVVTIDGNIQGTNDDFPGFFIAMGNVTIQNMIFKHLVAKGGKGGDGISGGGGGMGAGGAIYVAQNFLNGSNPEVTLINVSLNDNSAIGGDGGSYFNIAATGNEGGGGGGGFGGNGGSVTVAGYTGGAGGGGFGGNGGDVISDSGGGSGGGGFGSRATTGDPFTNLGNGGTDQDVSPDDPDQRLGADGNGYGLSLAAGSGAGGIAGGSNGGGGGGGAGSTSFGGGGGGGSGGLDGQVPSGDTPLFKKSKSSLSKANKITPANDVAPSGGSGADGGGSGGGAVVTYGATALIDGHAGNAGYGGGGGGGAGAGARNDDPPYSVEGGSGGLGGGGGGGGVNQSGATSSKGGDSGGGGGGGGGGPVPSEVQDPAPGGIDPYLGGGAGGHGAKGIGPNFGGGGGGGGSGLGGAIFVDSGLNFIIKAMSGTPTVFNTSNNTVTAGAGGTGRTAAGAENGFPGTALGNSIFLRRNSSLTFQADDINDLLTLGEGVSFIDESSIDMGAGPTSVFVTGNGMVTYNGSAQNYKGNITVNNAHFKVNGSIEQAPLWVCRNTSTSPRGKLSGTGTLGNVTANSGTISPDPGHTLTLSSLTLHPAGGGALGSLVHIDIDSSGTSSINVTGAATLAGTLEINIDPSTPVGQYTLLTAAGGITGTFVEPITFTGGVTPNYTLSYLPTSVVFNYLGSAVNIPATVNGKPITSPAVVCCGRPIILGPLPVAGSGPTTYTVTHQTGNVSCQIGHTPSQTYLKVLGPSGSCTITGTKDGITSSPFTVSPS